jgi:hypothetical protein
MWGKSKKRNSSATKNSIRSKVNNLQSAFPKELRNLWAEKEVVRLQMTHTHLHYVTKIHYFLLQTKSNPSKEFSDTGIEGSDGQAEADSEVKIQ